MQVLLFLILWFVGYSSSCLFQPGKTKGGWDDEDNPRQVDSDCECGLNDASRTESPWTLFILKKGDTPTLLCTATIVTSNLLVTSNDCLTLPQKKFNVYDIWRPKGGTRNVLDESDLIISSNPENATSPFIVVQIISSYRYAISSATDSDPEDDIVLIQVEPHFRTVSKTFSPICIPESEAEVDDLRGQSPYFLGFTDSSSERGWDYNSKCSSPSPPRSRRSTSQATSLPLPGSITGTIVDEDHCDAADDDTDEVDESLLCFRQTSGKPPKWGDGTLILNSASDDHRSFLVGLVASQSGAKSRGQDDEGVEYTRFNKISGVIKYIEFHASKTDSRWCHSDKLSLLDQLSASPEGRQGDLTPWEDLRLYIPPRLETLPCVCGLKNEGQMGRIIGGEQAIPHEYPWLTYIQNSRTYSTCTGEIISDRIVMTAAHCLQKVENPSEVVAYVNAHSARNPRSDYPITERRAVKRYFNHPKYVDGKEGPEVTKFAVDISLLELESPITFTGCGKGTRPICLPPPLPVDLKLPGSYAEIAGWGGTRHPDEKDPDIQPADKLKKAVIKIQSKELCRSLLAVPRELCTGNDSSIDNVFKGDSGGPLMVKINGTQQYMLVGEVNAGVVAPTDGLKGAPTNTLYVWYAPIQRHLRFIDYVSNYLIVGSSDPAEIAKKSSKYCKSYM